ncbi:MAG TPA: hypothetical protein VMV98_08680 [Acidobacteriaceae bacterium]|nr:hypothetical protein [Acidobacteriaceae bacterium]
MLEVHSKDDGFTVCDTEADEAAMVFSNRAEAYELVASLQIQELHAQLQRWSVDAVPAVY